MDIKEIVKKELNKKYEITESLKKISLHEDNNLKFQLTIDYLGSLIDDGYSENDMKNLINEQFSFLKDIFGNVGNLAQGGWSQFKEFLISNFLQLLGFKGSLANAIATAMNEMALADIINLFRSRQGCLEHGPTVVDAISEALVRYILEELTEKDSIAFNFIRNTVFEYVKSSQFGETLSKTLCDTAYYTSSKVEKQFGGANVKKNKKINTDHLKKFIR